MTNLTHKRGDTFDKTLPLSGPYSYYTSYLMTFRTSIPASSVVTDIDAGVVTQISSTGGSPGITGSGTELRAQIPTSVTNAWPIGTRRLYYDVQGKGRSGDANFVKTVESGEVLIQYDVTRTP